MLSRLHGRAAVRAALRGQRTASSFAARFEASVNGIGHRKHDQLKYGGWKGTCDSITLATLWPSPPLKGHAALQELAAFDGAVSKAPDSLTARLGRARARVAIEDTAGATADIDHVLEKAEAGSAEYCYALALQAQLAGNMTAKADRTEKSCCSSSGVEKAPWLQKASKAFVELSRHRPDHHQVLLAHGAYLLETGDYSAAERKLRAALPIIEHERVGREAATEKYISDEDSPGAISDYLDYKHEVIGSGLAQSPVRGDADMEKRVAQRYGSAKFTDQELQVMAELDARLAAGDLGLNQPLGLHGSAGVSGVRDYDGMYALEAVQLMETYTGGQIGKLLRSNAPVSDVLAELKGIPDNTTAPTSGTILSVQKKLGVSLAKQQVDRCKTLLGKALLAQGKAEEAEKVLGQVVGDCAYLGMHDALQARGDALLALGRVGDSAVHHQRARALETTPTGVDLPTIDEKAFRDTF
eukprot:TRINITY_DN20919_c0_g1_i1.p1 TRINITY_DN20919_c0_g1~~TRINITY_DN20919_c0_g1_i1.p1  ORF type:complete len:509 (+),score=162.16 TRINITY_DN20919_c0_g1_i1:119-1528(+)